MIDWHRSALCVDQIDHHQHIDWRDERIVVHVESIGWILMQRCNHLYGYRRNVACQPIVIGDHIPKGRGTGESILWDVNNRSVGLSERCSEVRWRYNVHRAAVERSVCIEVVCQDIDGHLRIPLGNCGICDRDWSGVDVDCNRGFVRVLT